MLFYQSHAKDVDHAWASSRTKEELDQVVEPFVQAKRQTGQWTQEDEAGYQLYQQETDPKTVSYTHLDVYKRQAKREPLLFWKRTV